MWLIPLVWGWFAVGTHHGRREQVVKKLHEIAEDITKAEASGTRDGIIAICDHRKDIKWIPMEPPSFDDSDTTKERRTVFGFSIAGDELADGPFYNYARCSTWSNFCKQIVSACVDTYSHLKQPPLTAYISPVNTKEVTDVFGDLNGNQSRQPVGGLKFSGLIEENHYILNEPLKRFAWKASTESDTALEHRKARAFVMAFVLQGVFGWSAFMIDYTTPTIGIGCRAFICMTYSLTSLSSCLLLIVASRCADSWSFQFERYRWSTEIHPELSKSSETEPSVILAMAAVGCRLSGKALAILNAGFIVIGCILEFAGVYESCFCKSTYLGLRSRAFISFLSAAESVQIARPYWFGGAGVAMLTVLIICFGYFTKVHHQFK